MRKARLYVVLGLSVSFVVAFYLPIQASAQQLSHSYRDGLEHFGQGRHVEAIHSFRNAADAGHAAAIDFLGWMYFEGKGVPKSHWIAFGYFMDSAAKGNDQACRNLGNMYFNGFAVEQDCEQAAKWWAEGAKRGAYRAANSLAHLLYTGDGLSIDKQRAIDLWAAAAKNAPQHDPGPSIALAFAQILTGNLDIAGEGRKQLHTLADAGNRQATDALKYLAARDRRDALLVEVPFIHQAHNYCGIASATMLLRFQGTDVSQFDVQKLCPDSKIANGVHWPKLVTAAGKCEHEWRIEDYAVTDEGFSDAKAFVIEELSAGRPTIIDWLYTTNGHSVVLCGYDKNANEFYFRNPGLRFPGIHILSEDRLKKMWGTRGYIPNNDVVRRALIRTLKAAPQSASP